MKDEIRNLRPADIIVFRGDDGTTRHSAVIQSIDRVRGTIRYLQSTEASRGALHLRCASGLLVLAGGAYLIYVA